ncbi:septal ring lytic transglycosylase RlpA family protein [Gloeocapsopsis sp. IPPAS B-1203]|uniref:septal ring lytic transglycosylase RlpA family protein n=1 Tax=Gloeocapsopsis sp. IPPAS B-1203 TaxID=2049454 RepID=UPI000C1A4369|nr:septal ring lytic transglycosylase RlpA family protein [Gloeocapsopsis sp. IPPAS B-1203]PIG93554.1 hypothetical protein CSQ79_11600 [Gloeocapsopsis sp. IPPAS B-1203]
MNKKLLWTTAALLATAIGIPPSYAESTSTIEPSAVNESATPISTPRATNAVKVGEYQSPTRQSNSVVARIQPHQLAERQAATIYVKNIPVLTFLDSDVVSSANANPRIKIATNANQADLSKADTPEADSAVRRATKVAAKINQLHLNGVDASKITAKWKANAAPDQGDRYAINLNNEELVEINSLTRLPDQTHDLSEDALQATNRLRRLLGNAPPLQEVADKPVPKPVAVAPQTSVSKQTKQNAGAILSGIASWYGPGFHGNRSASGERFNQNAMTAAHRSLPFGTKVRVTNKRNGRSVIVRINDRGPFTGGRIIDLSAAAARVLGVLNSGTAPVQVEVLGK